MPVPITIYPSDDLAAARLHSALESIGLVARYIDGRIEARTADDWRRTRDARAQSVRRAGTLTERILHRLTATRPEM